MTINVIVVLFRQRYFFITDVQGVFFLLLLGKFQAWDPTKAISRNVRITSAGDDSGKTFAVVGYDLYGYPMLS